MANSKLKEYIAFAIEKEIEAYEFFLQCSKQVEKESLKKTFRGFAEEEKKHEEMLADFTPETVEDLEVKEVQDLKIADYLTDIEFDSAMSIQDIFIMAMKREDSAYKMYNILAEKGTGGDPAAEKLFRFLAQEELRHKNYFQKEYDDHILQDN